MFVVEALSFFGAVGKHALALVAEREVYRCGNLLTDRCMPLNLLPDGFHGGMRPQKPVCELFVFSQKPQKQVLRFNERTAELAGLVSREEDDAPRFFGITLKHLYWVPPGVLVPYLLKILLAVIPLQRWSVPDRNMKNLSSFSSRTYRRAPASSRRMRSHTRANC